ncbi:protein-cysteine N-palmitoyltransferase Rasp [Scaptodrosophila lebanonensis]|uniref:Protein-cysteine N-palmitoyltransferase Rasp n=1 Tax=Drosophila lebanonensis TaxID=7225 RepID=A0A6J2U9I3_DROLE|nr:protein-cysteine N-palmitoyltransferase Rasp [Scaptodrosophila lebanonensis]
MSKCEIIVYFSVYLVYIIIGLYKIYELRDRILDASQFQFARGWQVFGGRRRDDSNDELENFTTFISTYWPYYLLHVLVGAGLRGKELRLQCYGSAGVCALALCLNLHWTSLVMCVALISSYYLVAQRHSKAIWLLSGFWILIINVIKNSQWWLDFVGYSEFVLLLVSLSWSLLRGCSYALTYKGDKSDKLAEYLGYALYFPTLTYGPFISYERYAARQHQDKPVNWLKFSSHLLRVVFWWLFMQCALHFFYIHYMALDVRAVAMMDSVFWQHAAGYFMGQFFFIYYVITYGLGISFAENDGIPAPSRPRCIGRIHFYSDMWRKFDEGFYEFLFKHIYSEMCGKRSSVRAKLGASAVTFGFVFLWHGCHTYVLMWSVLNFLCLTAEKCYKTLIATPAYKQWLTKYFSAKGAQRFNALLGTQLFIPAGFSNVYFISGKDVGDFLMRGAYMSGVGNYLALSFCSYCFFQCSELLLIKANKKTTKSD